MYQVESRAYQTFLLYKLSSDGTFEPRRMFWSLDSLIEYAVRSSNLFYRVLRRRDKDTNILEYLNLTGNDIYCLYSDGDHSEYRTRYYLITDKAGRIIDLNNYKEEIRKKEKELETRKVKNPYYSYFPPYRYRCDPVPYTGVCHGKYGRRIKSWFRSYRQDRIPEYRQFVRKKAMVPNMWDEEPVEKSYKSWKHNKKQRHQWG